MSAVNATTESEAEPTVEPRIGKIMSWPAFNWYQEFFELGKVCSSPPPDSSITTDFNSIRSQLLLDNKLFVDKTFELVLIMRPKEMCINPQFYVGGVTRFDVCQGLLGDCWFVAALASLAANKKLFSQVVPEGQSFEDGYVGMFRFRFWRFGEWVEVIIDDRLPTYIGQDFKMPIFLHSSQKNEFWSALLEKAYAKFRGKNYEAIDGGDPCEAMCDFTGGLSEYYYTAKCPSDLYTILLKAYERKCLIVCNTEPEPEPSENSKLDAVRLYYNHAYSVTKVFAISPEKRLLRIRNPWGHSEWNKAWSDNSEELKSISDAQLKGLEFINRDDGEFWMSYEDFIRYFERVAICHLSTDSPDPENKLKMTTIKGQWVKGVSAGGWKNWRSFYCNPQYVITLRDDGHGYNEYTGTVIIGLLQKVTRGQSNLFIGFDVYKINDGVSKPLDIDDFKNNPNYTTQFSNYREVSLRLRQPKSGSYLIVPSTLNPDEEGEFILRVMSEKSVQITSLGHFPKKCSGDCQIL